LPRVLPLSQVDGSAGLSTSPAALSAADVPGERQQLPADLLIALH